MIPRRRALPKKPLLVVGWREWIALPELGIGLISAKIDSGAETSCLHAMQVTTFRRGKIDWVRFQLPISTRNSFGIQRETPLLDVRQVRSSSGHLSLRPVIQTAIEMGGVRWTIELTLASRESMGFRMLIGRQAIAKHCLVDCSNSFLLPRPPQGTQAPDDRTLFPDLATGPSQ